MRESGGTGASPLPEVVIVATERAWAPGTAAPRLMVTDGPDGRRTVPAWSSPSALAAVAPDQPWVAVPSAELLGRLAEIGAARVTLDPPLAEAAR
jgi:hypothetical protein